MQSSNESSNEKQTEHSGIRRMLAWNVHLLTASGVICCLLALEATHAARWQAALTWLVVAVVIDAIDGTFARLVKVKKVLPNFDGALLDNLIDFTNYVIVSALIIHRSQVLPDQASFAMACAICLASAYQFCQADAKTDDNYFTGFPSYWNISALYLLSMGLSPRVNLVVIAVLVVMVFVPIKYIYVTRTKPFQLVTWPLTVIWAAMVLVILWQLPTPDETLVKASLLYFVYYFVVSVYLTTQTRGAAALADDAG